MTLRPGERLGPYWRERQRDPDGPDFLPGPAAAENCTHRRWTALGPVGVPGEAHLDGRGLLVPGGRGWSLDWWIGADDRWHLPSREVAVRQRLAGGVPVVETAMRIPGGDALHRAYAVAGPGGAFAVVEIRNDTPVPFALALAVRPYDLCGDAVVGEVALEGDGSVLAVDGRPAVLLPKPPARAAASTAAAGDVVHTVVAGLAGEQLPPVRCPEGGATAAVLFPLPHTATLRVLVPLPSPADRGRATRRGRRGARPAPVPAPPDPVPSAEQVAGGWAAHTGRGLRLVLPDDALADVVAVARCHLLTAVPEDGRAAAELVTALAQVGAADAAGDALAWFADEPVLDADGLAALGAHWRLTRDAAAAEAFVGAAAKGAEVLARSLEGRARAGAPLDREGRLRAVEGLALAADAMVGVGQPEVAAHMIDAARRGGAALRATDQAPPPPPEDDPSPEADARGPVVDHAAGWGFDLRATVVAARRQVASGDLAGVARLAWLVEVAGPTVAWPSYLHPRTGDGSHGSGHDVAVTAGVVSLARTLLVVEQAGGLALCPVLPPDWYGAGVEVHEAPTAMGRLSFAVRWHGDRPALLWELERSPGVGDLRLTAPGLDPAFATDELRGEALLSPTPPTPGASSPSFS